jgi:predicted acetyltransferase
MQLVKPTKKYEKSWKEAIQEFEDENRKGFWNHSETPRDINKYIQLTSEQEKGINIPKGWVPSSTYWLIDNNKFIGHVNIRHKLNDWSKKFAGHIGYAIRPTERNKGYGSKILELALQKAKKLGLKKVLLTCNESNIASKKIIIKNNGELYDKVETESEPKGRYWIEL